MRRKTHDASQQVRAECGFSLSKLREFIESANEQLIVRVKPRVEDASVIAFRKSLYWFPDWVNLLYVTNQSVLNERAICGSESFKDRQRI